MIGSNNMSNSNQLSTLHYYLGYLILIDISWPNNAINYPNRNSIWKG